MLKVILYRSRAWRLFFGTEYEIWADFGLVGSTEKKIGVDYEQFFRAVFFMFSWAIKKLIF